MSDYCRETVSNTGDTATGGSYAYMGSLQAEVANPGTTCDEFRLSVESSKSSNSVSYEVEPHDTEEHIKSEIFEQQCIEIKPDPGTLNSVIKSDCEYAMKSNEDENLVFLKGGLGTMHNSCNLDFKSPELFHLETKKEIITHSNDYCTTNFESPELLHFEVKTENLMEVTKTEEIIPIVLVKEETLVKCLNDDIKLEIVSSGEEHGDCELELTNYTPGRACLNKRIKLEPVTNEMSEVIPLLLNDTRCIDHDHTYCSKGAPNQGIKELHRCPLCQKCFSTEVLFHRHMSMDHEGQFLAVEAEIPIDKSVQDVGSPLTGSDEHGNCELELTNYALDRVRLNKRIKLEPVSNKTSEVRPLSASDTSCSDHDNTHCSIDARNQGIKELHRCPLCQKCFPTEILFHRHVMMDHEGQFLAVEAEILIDKSTQDDGTPVTDNPSDARRKFHPGHKCHSPHYRGPCLSIRPNLGESDVKLSHPSSNAPPAHNAPPPYLINPNIM